jgi:hypothetical protein
VDRGCDLKTEAETKKPGKTAQIEATARAQRQVLWLKKANFGSCRGVRAWRPAKRHRGASKRWEENTDHQIRFSTVFEGWISFAYDPAKECWSLSNWRNWNHCSVAIDQGPECLTGHNGLIYWFLVNSSRWCDQSHGLHRDFGVVLKELDLDRAWTVHITSLNVRHGPDDDDYREWELKSAMEHAYSDPRQHRMPLFQERAPMIKHDLERFGGVNFDEIEGEDDAEKTWNYCKASEKNRKKGYRVNRNRFLGTLYEAEKRLPVWTKERLN